MGLDPNQLARLTNQPPAHLKDVIERVVLATLAEDVLTDTIPHEIAHLACNLWWPRTEENGYKKVGHGPKWQFVMTKLGLNPKRTHEYEVKPARRTNPTRYIFTCSCPNIRHALSGNRYTRFTRGQNYICKLCNSELTYTGETE